MKIKTIDINVKKWRDKVNGNTYFSAIVTINYGMKNEKIIKLPFQYGSGNHYKSTAFKALQNNSYIPKQKNKIGWQYYKDNNIIVRDSVHENCRKKELKM